MAIRLTLAPGAGRPVRGPSFTSVLRAHRKTLPRRTEVSILQLNVGKRCNQACLHCHVEAGPTRTELMSDATIARVLALVDGAPGLKVVDVTGGAPELHPRFRYLVRELRARGLCVIDRCNLTVLFEDGMEDLPRFLADQGVDVVASLPCYGRANVDMQRGKGVFERSIAGLRQLNAVGYGRELRLDLVYNPGGPFLPPAQAELEQRYRKELRSGFGVEFTTLLTLTNMPISRFAHALERDGEYDQYMELLCARFNPDTISGLMCRNQVSVGYDGSVYDCDFNQMLTLPLGGSARPTTIWDFAALKELADGPIGTGPHCLGCTAGAGSSCGGAIDP